MGSRRRSWLTGEGSRDCGRSETWIARCKVQGVLVMATKEDPAVNGHPGDDSTGRQQGSEGRGNKGEQGPGRAKNESNAQNRPKSEPNCCLLENGKRCTRPASNASYSKRIQATVAQKKLRLAMDPTAQHIYICEHHKNVIQTVRTKRKRRESEDSTEEQQQQQGTSGASASNPPLRQGQGDMVDLFQLQMNTLRRYKNHFKVTSRPGLNKAQLADSLSRHFHSLPVVEKEAITYFLYMIKTGQSRLDPQGGKTSY